MKPPSEKFLIAVAVVAFGALTIAFGTVTLVSRKATIPASTLASSTVAPAIPETSASLSSASIPAPDLAVTKPIILTARTSFHGQGVTVADLAALADDAKLNTGALQHMDKALWAKELPIAENMLQGMCDCEERNWINHFIEAGKLALAGAKDYYQAVAVLNQLPRDTHEMAAAVAGE